MTAASPRRKLPAWAPQAMGYCLSVVCLAWVLHGYQFNELLPAIRTLDWGWVTIAVLSDLSVYVVHGWRWNTLLEPVARLRLTRTVQAIYIGLFANEILPLRVGEVIRCYLLAHWNNLNLSVTLASVGVERLIDGFWMIAAFLITTTYVKGIPPDLNYLVRLGWSHGDQEVFTREELIALFDIRDVNKAAAAFNPEKLLWLNQQHMMRAQPAQLVPYLRAQLKRLGLDSDDEALLEGVVVAQRERAKTLKEMAHNSRFFFTEDIELDPKAAHKHLTAAEGPALKEVRARLAALPEWSATAISDVLNALAAERGVGLGKIAQPLRVAVTGSAVSPPIDATLALLGRKRALARLDAGIARCLGG